MPTFRVRVSDEVTIARNVVISVEADDAASACSRAIQMALDGKTDMADWSEEDVDNTPYEAEVII